MISFPNMYITHIQPRSLRGIVQEGGQWVDIATRKPVSAKTAERVAMDAILTRYPETDAVAFEAKIERYRKLAN